MALHETFLYINRNIEEVVKGFTTVDLRKIEDEEQIVYVADGDTPTFALCADTLSPAERNWTHLLHSDPNDGAAMAATLRLFQVKATEIKAATKYNGEPLIDLSDIKLALEMKDQSAGNHGKSTASLATATQSATKGGEESRKTTKSLSDNVLTTKAKTKFPPSPSAQKKWVIIDAQGFMVGRLAAIIAARLLEGAKITTGIAVENVMVVNASKVHIRAHRNLSYRSGVKPGLRLRGMRFPKPTAPVLAEQVIYRAVGRLLAKKSGGRQLIKQNLKIHAGPEVKYTQELKKQYSVEVISDREAFAEALSGEAGFLTKWGKADTPLDRITRKL